MKVGAADAPPLRRAGSPRAWELPGALAIVALVGLDVAAVPAALPSVRVELGSSTSGLVWTQDAYLLALAVALIALRSGGALDRRLLAAAGLAGYGAGAVVAFTADSTAALVTGRALQGAGSAALLAGALGALRRAAGEPGPAAASLGAGRLPPLPLAALVAGALLLLAAAPLLGGALAEHAGWRWLFRLELVPAALAALVLLARAAGDQREPRAAARGRPGALASGPPGAAPAPSGGPAAAPPAAALARPTALAAGLVCAAVGLVQSGPWGWASLDTLLLLLAGAALLAFAWRDGLGAAGAAALALAGSTCAALLFAPQYFELVRGLSPLRAGLLTVALTGAAAAIAPLAALPARRVPAGWVLAGGLAGAALGALGATRIDPASSYALVVLSLALLGAGAGAAAGALTYSRGAAPGELVTAAATGGALVVAAAGALFQRAQLDERDGGGSFEEALAAGLAGSGWLLAAILAAAALRVWTGRRERKRTG